VTCGRVLAISAKIGAMKRHGPHQAAVKSTTICQSDFLSVLWTCSKIRINNFRESQIIPKMSQSSMTRLKHKNHRQLKVLRT
jgi:hypothetical protein